MADPVSPQYTLLRVKRKRDDNPVASLILAGETEPHPISSKRSAVTDIRTLLSCARLADDEKATTAAEQRSTQRASRATLRRVFRLVGTVSHAASSPDDALLSRLAAMQTARQAKAVHPSIAPGSTASEQRHRQMEAQQQRAAAARTEKLREARAATSAASASPVSSTSPSSDSAATSAPFTFLDVSITKHFPATAPPAPSESDLPGSAAAVRGMAERPVVAETAAQEHRDELFSRAMSIVRAMPEKEKMAAYSSLLDDYWQATTGSADTQQPPFTQQLQQQASQPKPRLLAGERIDLSSLAPPAQRLYAGAAVSQPHHVIASEDESQYVYDVYRVEADGEADGTATSTTDGSTEGEVASVVMDSRVAGWFGLVVDDEDVVDSDEDEEDENREGWEGNEYPEDEEDEEDDDDDARAKEELRMVAGDEDEEFYRLRQQLKHSKNELIAMSDEEAPDEDGDEDSAEEDDDDEYARSHRQYTAGHYDNEI